MKLTCVCPVWGRPQRTLRAIVNVANQQFEGAETIFMGDGCSIFQENVEKGVYNPYIEKAAEKGNKIVLDNLPQHFGGWGYMARKEAIGIAKGEYIIFYDNDDVILPFHFNNYYSFMEENPSVGLGYFNTFVEPWKKMRDSCLGDGGIGHSEIIVKAELVKQFYEADRDYGHDWKFIKKLIENKIETKKSTSQYTYIVKGVPSGREKDID